MRHRCCYFFKIKCVGRRWFFLGGSRRRSGRRGRERPQEDGMWGVRCVTKKTFVPLIVCYSLFAPKKQQTNSNFWFSISLLYIYNKYLYFFIFIVITVYYICLIYILFFSLSFFLIYRVYLFFITYRAIYIYLLII